MGKRTAHTLSLTPVKRIACGADHLNMQLEQAWLEKVNASTTVQIDLKEKARKYAAFKPRRAKGSDPQPEVIERYEPKPRHTTSKLRFSGRQKLMVKGFGPGW